MEVREEKRGVVVVKDDKVFTWPTLVAKEFLAAIFVTVGLLFYSFVTVAPLRELSNPGRRKIQPSSMVLPVFKKPWFILTLGLRVSPFHRSLSLD